MSAYAMNRFTSLEVVRPRAARLRALLCACLLSALGIGAACALPGPGNAGRTETIAIVHTNDIHGHITSQKATGSAGDFEIGGLSSLVGYVDGFRKQYGNRLLLLDAGDAWQGTYASNVEKGATVTAAMNLAGYQAMALGNHDFDFGQENVRQRAEQAHFPFLGANVLSAGSGQPPGYAKPYVVVPVGSLKVAVLGLANPGTPVISRPANVDGLQFLPAEETAAKYLPELHRQADLVVALTHLGLDYDEQLASAVSGIDVIVGGHSHTELRTAKRVGSTIIVQAGSKAAVIGRLEITYDTQAHKITRASTQDELLSIVDKKTAPRADVADLVRQALVHADQTINRPIGATEVDLEQQYAGEFPLGNLVVDAMLADPITDKPAEVALHNNAGIRARIPRGPITYGQVYEVLPFDNLVVAMDLKGEDLWAALEKTFAGRPGNLQVAGLVVQVDTSRPVGERVRRVLVQGQPLDKDRLYRVHTLDYLASGGDGQEALKKGTNLVFGAPVADVVAEYIQSHSPIAPQVEGRIRMGGAS